jgi:beta-lactam-binding protein with PASTA domain
VDGRSDVYSAGCVLYELVCGLPPFSGDGASVLHSHLHEKVPAPSSEHPEVPEEIDEIVARATARDIGDRYSGSEEMLADVRQALSHSEEAAAPLSDLVAEVTSEVSEAGVPTLARAEPRRMRRVGLIAVSAALLAFLVMAALLWRPVRVPELTGMRLSEATAALEAAGLTHEVERMSSDQPPETVIDASHPAGDWTLKGRSVVLTVSRGPPLTTVPDLAGMDLSAAREDLENANLLVGDIAFVFSPEPPETVVGQEPGPGRARQGVPVNLTVSRGPEVVEIPKVVGQPYPQAAAALEKAGFEVARNDVFHDSEAGTVVRQTPQGGKRAEKGSRVTVQVSKGPEPFDMPDVDGEACSAAKDELEELGLVVVIRSQADSACGSNRVLDQDPLPGTEVRKGDEATLYVE